VGRAELERSLSSLDIWLIVFGVFVAIGAVGGSVAGFLHWRRSGELQALQTSENLALQKDIARLSTEAESARAAIATANEHAATAEQRAAEANLELAKFKAPRQLTPDQQHAIANNLRPFPDIKFDAGLAPGDAEAASLLVSIETALSQAGWTEINWNGGDIVLNRTGRPTAGLSSATNVIAAVFPGQSSKLIEAATSLVAALNDNSIAAQLQDATGIVNTTQDAIHILIGRKM
jgi:hypothetical protein